jgi:hypothetical protein
MSIDRRSFLFGSAALFAAGDTHSTVHHLLPAVSHDRILVKASFRRPLKAAVMRAGGKSVTGARTDSEGQFWTFDVAGLKPGTLYELQLLEGHQTLGDPWTIRTFPHPSESVSNFRLLVYTCAGGHPVLKLPDGRPKFLPIEVRQRLLRRALTFQPQAVIANGDHIYWDLLTSGGKTQGNSPEGIEYAGTFNRIAPVLGTPNERVLSRAAGPQIADLYGTLFRGVPVFFISDDHDHFDNDEASDTLVSFPPDAFMLRAARATRRLYYPEFLPDANRPLGLAGSAAADTPNATSEAFGTLRFGKLAELLLYDCRRYLTLAGPTATFIPRETEDWIRSRLSDKGVRHVAQVPSVPVGWSAGKWGDWYPDMLDAQGKLGTSRKKPHWQTGWGQQHDRLLAAASGRRQGVPLFLCGDLHAQGLTEIQRTGNIDLKANPVFSALTGPVSTGPTGWPSSVRGTPPQQAQSLLADERLAAVENHGFVIADFQPERVSLRFFRWNPELSEDALDTLEAFRTVELAGRG